MFTGVAHLCCMMVKFQAITTLERIPGRGHFDGYGGVDNAGVFEMYGGKITGNTAYRGGGVHNSGTFIMHGGTISGNQTYSVDSFFLFANGIFIMYGGTIYGDVYGTVKKFGGEIYGNYTEDSNSFFMLFCAAGVVVVIGVVGFLLLYFKLHKTGFRETDKTIPCKI